MDLWDTRESDLIERHEELLIRREALLRGTESYYDSQNNKPSSFIADYSKAMQRNDRLRDAIRTLDQNITRELEDTNVHKEFHTLKENYWTMVINILPIWNEEQDKYDEKYGTPCSGLPSGRVSNRSTEALSDVPVPRSPRYSRLSPRLSNRSHSPAASPRHHGSRTQPAQQSQNTIDSQNETLTVPPLELDFSMGDDLTTISQVSARKQKGTSTTPKSALASTSAKSSKNKKVSIQDDKKALKEQKKAQEKAAKLEKERLKKEKRDSSRSKSPGKDKKK